MGKGSAPQAPDPVQTANAQTASNKETAMTQAQLNNVNQVTPYGNLTYTSTPGAGGVPQYTATQSLSPTGQKLFDSTSQTQQNLADIGVDQSDRLGTALAQPFSLDNDAVESRLMELGRTRLDPQLADRRDALQTELVNRGIRPGSTAYDRAMTQSNQGENDAFNQLLLNGRSQAISEALMERNQPINESLALASGTQLQSPSFVGTPQTGVGGTDVAGITQNAYNSQMNAYNQQQQQNQSLMGGLFGLGANAMMAFSDKRLKKNIRNTGVKVGGVDVKTWDWKNNGQSDVGVIAQDLEKIHPQLVDNSHETGFKRVDYGNLISMGMEAA